MRITTLPFALMFVALTANAQTLPDGPGKEAFQQNCVRCHTLRSVVAAKHTRQEWDNVVTDMIGRGASIAESDIGAIVEYLAKAFPKDTTGLNVNRATAKELVDGLRLTSQEAEVLVRYREENGYIQKFQDLEKIPGLDIKKFEAAKTRLQF
jgi:competence protein ComEA